MSADVSFWFARLAAEHERDFGPAMKWLVEHAEESREPLRSLVERGDRDMMSRRAYEVLGRIGNPADVALLAAQLARAGGTLADDAAHGLALHSAAAARQALVDAAGSKDPDIACAAISALGERGDGSVRPVLQKLAGHPDEDVRHRAKLALEELPR